MMLLGSDDWQLDAGPLLMTRLRSCSMLLSWKLMREWSWISRSFRLYIESVKNGRAVGRTDTKYLQKIDTTRLILRALVKLKLISNQKFQPTGLPCENTTTTFTGSQVSGALSVLALAAPAPIRENGANPIKQSDNHLPGQPWPVKILGDGDEGGGLWYNLKA